jgi:hypothetical protein
MLRELPLLVEWSGLPWAGIGACLAGAGSLLSGIAAYRLATRKEEDDEPKPEARSGDR